MPTTHTLCFHLSDAARTAGDWYKAGPYSADGNAKRYAREHGNAIVWRADDSATMYSRNTDGTLRQKTYADAAPLRMT